MCSYSVVLAANHSRGVSTPGRVVVVCWAQYMADLAAPDAQWIKPEIANGEYVDWLRVCGWMSTRFPPPRPTSPSTSPYTTRPAPEHRHKRLAHYHATPSVPRNAALSSSSFSCR